MTQKVTDEMLMAFVDGETDEATRAMIEQVLAADAALAARAERFRASRALLREAFGDARREAVPEALVEAVLRGGERGTVVPFARWRRPGFALPLAACLALAIGAAGYLAGSTGGSPADPLGRAALAEALAGTKSGESRPIAVAGREGRFETLATYRIEGGFCRSFDLSGVDISLSGVGCDRGQGWNLDLTVARQDGGGLYAPASEAGLQGIDAYLDALEVSAPLTAQEEATALGR